MTKEIRVHLTRRQFMRLAASGLTGAALASCAPEASPSPIASAAIASAATSTASAAAQPVRIVFWTEPWFKNVKGKEAQTKEFGDYEKLETAAYTQLHPNVTFEIQVISFVDLPTKVPAALAGGTPIDLHRDYLGRTPKYAAEGLLEDLNQILPKAFLDDYDPAALKLYTIDGKLHGLPLFAFAGLVVLNRAIWEEKGKENLLPPVDNPVWTFDQFETALRAVAEKDKMWPLAIHVRQDGTGDTSWLQYLFGFGAKMYRNGDYSKTTLNSPESVKALEWLLRMQEEGVLLPGATSLQQVRTPWFQRQTAVIGADLSLLDTLASARAAGQTKEPIKPMFAMVPNAPGVNNGLILGPTGWVIFKQTDSYKRQVLADLLVFLNGPEFMKDYVVATGYTQFRKSVPNPLANDPNYTLVQKLVSARGTEDMGLSSKKYADLRPLLPAQVQAVLAKQKSATQAMADYETAFKKVVG